MKKFKKFKNNTFISNSSLHRFWDTTLNFQDHKGIPCILTIIQVMGSASIPVAYYSGDLFFSLFYKISLFLSKKNLQIFLFSPFLFLRDDVRSDLWIYQKQKLTSFNEIVALNWQEHMWSSVVPTNIAISFGGAY